MYYTHGGTYTPEYRSWQMMKSRCRNPNNASYKNYGGRGIKICKRWINSFENFLKDMGPRPSAQHTLDRKNNDGNYTPKNCQWATKKEQVANRRPTSFSSRMITYKGETLTIVAWAHRVGIKGGTLHARLTYCRWDVERALTTPVQRLDVEEKD